MPVNEAGAGCFKLKVIEYHDYKTLMGPCFISFSIPLLVPGVVLTIVGAYGNEHTFSTFGGWHITGIVILSIAVTMLTIGIILKCCFQPIISADVEEQLSPTSSMITGSKNLAYEKDKDTESCSSGSRGNRKVAHFDSGKKHRFVSTHEGKGSNSNISNEFLAANGVLHNSKINTKTNSNKRSQKDEIPATKSINTSNSVNHDIIDEDASKQSKRRTVKADKDISKTKTKAVGSSNVAEPTVPPPAYEDVLVNNKTVDTANKTRSHVSKTTHGSIKTIVTTSVTAEAETALHSTSGNQPRDHSSDANENSEFLPVKKRRKKKKRRHRRSLETLSNGTEADTVVEAPLELSELPIKPVLIHNGEPHHNHNQHVHFENGPDFSEVNTAQEFD